MTAPRHKRFCGSPEARLWAKVERRGPDDCWNWTGGVTRPGSHGYGRIFISYAARPRSMVAHRLAWMLANGPVPPDMEVCHRCDNPRCCNPAHLFLGTHTDNMRDCSSKHRTFWQTRPAPRGDAHPNTKTPDVTVMCMRMEWAMGIGSQSQVADRFSVPRKIAQDLISGRKRTHLPTVEPLKIDEARRTA